MADNGRIQELLEAAFDSGATPERVCAGFPDLLPQLRERWERCRQLGLEIDEMFPSGDSSFKDDPADFTKASDELPVIPGYEIGEVLGRGGMGIVYKARHLHLKRTIALKMLLAGPYASRVERARFLREAQSIAALRHDHIVQVYDVGEFGGRAYFSMEFVDGMTLADRLDGVPLPAGQAAAMLSMLAVAIEAAHVAGIIHRDLKPANILLTADGTPKITDFGLARDIEGQDMLTMSGARVGTPSYMAPEQASTRAGTIGPATDVYALGAVLYEMLTGRPPFCGESAAETERQLLSQDPVAPSKINARVPRDLETICLKCL